MQLLVSVRGFILSMFESLDARPLSLETLLLDEVVQGLRGVLEQLVLYSLSNWIASSNFV